MSVADVWAELGAKTNVTWVILTLALISTRILPVIILTPFLGGAVAPAQVKLGLGITLAIVLFPAVAGGVTNIPLSAGPFISLLFKELFIGLVLTFIVNTVFDAARIAGNLLDTMSGASMAQVMVPQLQEQATMYATFKYMLAVTLFLTLNGHHLVIETLADSLLLIPLDAFPGFSGGTWGFFEVVLRVFANMFRIGVALAAPGLIAVFLTDLSMGMINRVAPQVQVFFLSMTLKPMVATATTFVVIFLVMERMADEFAGMLRILRDAVRMLA